MAVINYNDIDFKKSICQENKKIQFNNSEIEIISYLPTKDKYDLIMITLQKAFEKNIYNTFKVDIYFALNVIYSYTNIVFPNNINEDELFDILKKSGFIDLVFENIDKAEIQELRQYINEMSEIIMKYRNTFGSVFENFVEMLPANMEKASALIDGFDPQKYEPLLKLATDLKGGKLM